MKKIVPKTPSKSITPKDIVLGNTLNFNCCVHKIKWRSSFVFVTLKTGRYTFLAVHNPKYCEKKLNGVHEGAYINVTCTIREEKRAENGLEIAITDYEILSTPMEEYPLPVSDKALDCSPEEMIELRAVSMRHPIQRAVMRIFGDSLDAFSFFMKENEFLRVRLPKITAQPLAEDKDSFVFDFFGEKAYLSSDPYPYLTQSLAFFERIYDVAEIFFGKKRNSPRLLAEYTSLRFELAYGNMEQAMETVAAAIKFITETLKKNSEYELKLLEAKVPEITEIPKISFDEAMSALEKDLAQADLDPTDEVRICEIAEEQTGCEFVFVTNMPTQKRPDYYVENKSFVLLFRGMEIASGGEMVYSGNESSYDFIRYGLPPHCGAGIGAERFVMKLLGLNNIREVSLFPRDIRNLRP